MQTGQPDGLHESPYFDAREKAALAWAEALTLLPATRAEESVFAVLKLHFSDLEIVELSFAISLANFWNRMASGFRREPEFETPSKANGRACKSTAESPPKSTLTT